MQTLTEKDYKKILVCLTLYLTSLFAANTLGIKIMPFLFGTHLSVGVFCFPIVFIMTDLIGEVYGKKMAKNFVLAGVTSIALFLVYSLISTVVPWAEEGLWVKDGYNQIFGLTARISIASLVAFFVGEYQDVISFFFLKKKIGEKNFWLRSNLSNIWSQFLDTVIFMIIAFLGVYPISTLVSIIFTWWLFKVLMGFLYTPLSYLGIYILRGSNKDNANQNLQNQSI
ncbi:MAG: queuosine precursor transporter [Candidatus Pacebacteria bacterium]|nr:queuosine precursor transporter [Candidatus Paceibacterota bacterium]MBP9839514.1 queuosine precursor transporter [Candidatus Paceibacterota bacterium]